MTSEGLGEMFEGDSADTCAEKCPLTSMGGRAEGLVCTDTGARTPISASGNLLLFFMDGCSGGWVKWKYGQIWKYVVTPSLPRSWLRVPLFLRKFFAVAFFFFSNHKSLLRLRRTSQARLFTK